MCGSASIAVYPTWLGLVEFTTPELNDAGGTDLSRPRPALQARAFACLVSSARVADVPAANADEVADARVRVELIKIDAPANLR